MPAAMIGDWPEDYPDKDLEEALVAILNGTRVPMYSNEAKDIQKELDLRKQRDTIRS